VTYLLTITICAIVGPGDAACDTQTGRVRADRDQCEELRQPMQDHVQAEAKAAGMQLLYLSTRCKPGNDA